MNYLRATVAGTAYFFTAKSANRGSYNLLTEQLSLLRETRQMRKLSNYVNWVFGMAKRTLAIITG